MSDPRMCELAEAYALGALDQSDLRGFEAHLEQCDDCRAAVADARAVAGALAAAVPEAEPPAHLKARVLEAARSGPRLVREAGSPSPPSPVTRITPWLAAAGFGFAIWAGAAYFQRGGTLADARAELADARALIETLEVAQANRDSMLAALAGPAVETATLTSTASQPQVRLFWNQERNRLLVTAFDLPAAGPGRTYQLWGLAPDANPVSLGTFDTDAGGRAVVLQTVAAGSAFAQSAVTDEPAGGSPQPTTQPFLVGAWVSSGP